MHINQLRAITNFSNRSTHNTIDHFTVVCLVAWPLNESEAGGDLVFDRNLTAFLMLIPTN